MPTNAPRRNGEPVMAIRDRIPTADDLIELSHWGRVAFACRCAQRVLPLYMTWVNETLPDVRHRAPVDLCLEFALHSSRTGRVVGESPARTTLTVADFSPAPARPAAYAAAYAANSVMRSDTLDTGSYGAVRAAHYAMERLAQDVGLSKDPNDWVYWMRDAFRRATWIDFLRLRELRMQERWSENSPVDPDWLGPLWTEGTKRGWSSQSVPVACTPAMQFEFIIPAGLDESARTEFRSRVAHFYASLSEAHVMMGGTGLRILDEAGATPRSSLDEAPHDCSPTSSSTPEAVLL
jgi:hypothetical protein